MAASEAPDAQVRITTLAQLLDELRPDDEIAFFRTDRSLCAFVRAGGIPSIVLIDGDEPLEQVAKWIRDMRRSAPRLRAEIEAYAATLTPRHTG